MNDFTAFSIRLLYHVFRFNSSSSHFHKEETENMSVDSEIRQNKSENDGKGKLSESILGSEI